jgi:drug/metabolite transporter (DMT)-like permease
LSLQARGYLIYLTAALMFAINGTVAKAILLSGFDASRLSQLRITAAFLVLLLVVAIARPAALRIRRDEILLLIAYGALGVVMTQWLYFEAIARMPVGVSLLIEFTAPLWVALWFRFGWRYPTRRMVWFALFLALLGLALVAQVWQGFRLSTIGVLAGFGAALALALYYVLGDVALRREHPRDPVSLTMWGFGAGALFWVIAQPWWSFPWENLLGQGDLIDTTEVPVWLLATYMVIFGTVIPFLLVVTSLKSLRASQASVVGLTEPLLAILIAWVLLGETMSGLQLIGGAFILIGVFLAERSRTPAELT